MSARRYIIGDRLMRSIEEMLRWWRGQGRRHGLPSTPGNFTAAFQDRPLIFRVASATQNGSNYRWTYSLVEQAKASAGLDGWSDMSGGLTVSGYNLNETNNGATGAMGNGITLPVTGATVALLPIPTDTLVRVWLVMGTQLSEYWFDQPNPISVECA